MKRDKEFPWQKLSVILIGLFLSSVLLSLPEWVPVWVPHWMCSLAEKLGEALLIAIVIGSSIDWFFGGRLVKDAFEASLGYLLPPELKPELKWIYDQKIMCVESRQIYELTKQGENVEVVVSYYRRFKNLGRSQESVSLDASLDKGSSSDEFLEFGYRLDGQEWRMPMQDLQKPTQDEWAVKIQKGISLPDGKEVAYWWKSRQLKRARDEDHIIFSRPTVNPLVIIRKAEGLMVEVKVAHREKLKSLGSSEYQLEATLLSDQHILVRWKEGENA